MGLPVIRQVPAPACDPRILLVLEEALERAHAGEICGVGLVLVPRGGDVEAGWERGAGCTVHALHYGAATLAADLLGCRMGVPGEAGQQ